MSSMLPPQAGMQQHMVSFDGMEKHFGVRLETRSTHASGRDYSAHFTDRSHVRHLARRSLERLRSDYELAEGQSDAHLACGHFLTLIAHPHASWNDLWLLTEVIHCDQYGRGKVQFQWDQNIEHDQKIRVGHQRHDSVEADSYSEFRAEEHRTTHGDRKSEVRASDHLSVGQNQHVKIGQGQFIEADNEIHYHAGSKVVIDAGMELTAKGGGSWLKLDPSGVTLSGAQIRFNSGGSAGQGSGARPILPGQLKPAAADKAGYLLIPAQQQALKRAAIQAQPFCAICQAQEPKR